MSTIRPQDLPELRVALKDFATSADGVEYWDDHAQLPYYQRIRATSQQLQEVTEASLTGDLFFVSTSMAELSATAGQSLPVFSMQPQDLPSRCGVVLFESVPELLAGHDIDCDSGNWISISGAVWASDNLACWITPIASTNNAPLTLGGPVLMPFLNEEAQAQMPPFTRNKGLGDFLISTLRATWLLMQQPLSAQSEVTADRHARKRLRRAGHEPAPVRVIELRRPKTSSSTGDSDREYHHQWIVRGHWRQQWHPKRQLHRPVWIAPHVKGPEGAPLIGGEKVYALKR